MKKAQIEIILQVSETDEPAIADLKQMKREIESGNFQRGFTKAGARKVTATFKWMGTGTGYSRIKSLLAISFMHYLDENKNPGKMCLSNGECADIEKAFAAQDWKRLNIYAEKYLDGR